MRIAAVASLLFLLSAPLCAHANEKPAGGGNADAAKRQTEAVEKIIRDYLLEHPEVVIEALEAYKRQQAEREQQAARRAVVEFRKEIFEDPHSVADGNLEGDVTLVEFFDYRCGFCKRIHPIIDEVLKRDKGVRRVYKEWPILGPESVFASKAAIAARRQGDEKYVAFHRALMESRGALKSETVLEIAASVGLDTKRLQDDLTAPAVERIIQRNFELAKALRLNGTPSFVIGDTILRGGADIEKLLSIVQAEREKG